MAPSYAEMTRFIAIDGEADNKGRYIILCDSEGRVLFNPNGITSSEAFDFLLCLPKRCEIVCYGLNYDANQWLKDLPRANLTGLAATHRTTWRGEYKLEWIPSKMFTVSVPGKTTTVCEVFGFFQTSFVKALQQWGFEAPAEIEEMKKKRGTFSQRDLQAVVHYCQHECRLLVQMMERLADACKQANCVPRRRWIGAGSIASSLLTSKGARRHHAYDADLFGRELTDDVLRAYFGGRVELYRQGWTPNAIAHDIRSAYPFAAMQMPSLTDATVERTAHYDPTAKFALWRVTWEGAGGQVAPFPVRLTGGDICYPASGEGVYHAAEVAAAIASGFDINIRGGVILKPASGERPFEWIRDVYEHRARFKREGNYAEKALKLGLNSVYGKTAQGYGFGSKPPFQSYFWAGYITSFTRARALQMLVQARTPVMTATDGIVVGGTQLANESAEIGGWEVSSYKRIATVQPGVYVAEVDGERLIKSRGFFARDVDYDAMLTRFYDDPLSCYNFRSRRFIGLKVALHRTDFGVWRQWIEERRSIAFEIKNKRRVENSDGTVSLYPSQGPFESLPYVPKQSLYDDPSDEQLENMVRDDQPHREVD